MGGNGGQDLRGRDRGNLREVEVEAIRVYIAQPYPQACANDGRGYRIAGEGGNEDLFPLGRQRLKERRISVNAPCPEETRKQCLTPKYSFSSR